MQSEPRAINRIPLGIAGVKRVEIVSFIRAFYLVARADAKIGPVFSRIVPDDQWEAHFETMADFWSAVVFGGEPFRGDPMLKHARIKDISPEHFDRWLEIFESVALRQWPTDIAQLLIYRARQIAPSLMAGVHRAREKKLVTIDEMH